MEQLPRRSALARELRALGREASARRRSGRFLAEGARIAADALDADVAIDEAIVTREWSESEPGRRLLDRLRARATRLWWAEASVLEYLLPARSPQGVALVVRRPERDAEAILRSSALVLWADGLSEPGNLGTIARSTEAAGADALIVSGAGVDPFHPAAVRGAAGAAFRLPLLPLERERASELLRACGHVVRPLVADDGESLWEAPLESPLALVVGSEAHGLDATLLGALDAPLSIPMSGAVESLSVGAAAAVALFELARRRG